MKLWKWLLNNAGKVLSVLALIALTGGWFLNALPVPKNIARADDLKSLQQTVQILADVSIESWISQKEAEIQGIKRHYGNNLTVEAQLKIDSLQADIDRLKSKK